MSGLGAPRGGRPKAATAARPKCAIKSAGRRRSPRQKHSPSRVVFRMTRLIARFRLLGTAGLLGMALAGIEMAAWDVVAKERFPRLGGGA